MSLLQIMLIVVAALLAAVLVIVIAKFCVKVKKEALNEQETTQPQVDEESQPEQPVEEVQEEPVVEQTAYQDEKVDDGVVESVVEEQIDEQVAQPIEEQPVVEQVAEDEVIEQVADEQPVEEQPVAQEPVVEENVVATAEQVEETAVSEQPDEEPKPVVAKPVEKKKPVAKKTKEPKIVIGDLEDNGADKAVASNAHFCEKMLCADDKTKGYYDQINNCLKSYKKIMVNVSAKGVAYSYAKQVVARLALHGKTVKLFLALDTDKYDAKIYGQKDVSDVKAYADVPFSIKVNTEMGLDNAKKLIADLAKNKGIEQKPRAFKVDSFAVLRDVAEQNK